MTRVPAEDRRQVEVTVEGTTYRQRNGFFEVDNDRHASGILQAGGYGRSWQVGPPPKTPNSYRCPECRKLKFFTRCGSCDVDCVKE